MRNATSVLLALVVAASAACGGGQATAKDAPPTEATTDSAATDETTPPPGESVPPPLPAPDNVSTVPAAAERSPSGLAWMVIEEGDGAGSPTIDSTITVHYTGWTTDGEMFDSSVVRGEPIEFPLSKLILGWQEGIPMMTKGETRRFWIPAELAYGNSDRPGAPQGLLVFDIELLDFDMSQTPVTETKEE